jgi:drug/metabolite transporter (DMT)-like permease
MTATTGLTRLAAAPSMAQVAVALGGIYVVWGSTYGAIRLMVEGLPPLVSAGLRFLTASILVAGALLVRHGRSRLAISRPSSWVVR